MKRLVVCLVLLAGCGTSHAGHPPPPVSTPAAVPIVGDHNPADVMFLQMAIAHHTQGVDLVRLAEDRPVRAQVRDLAGAIEVTQRSEIDTMTSWLTTWAQPTVVDTNPAAHAHHGGLPDTDPETIADLARAPDGEFERRFLTLLTGHQHNAVAMARTELTDGVSPPVRQFADRVVRSRTGQIQRLLTLSAG
ncbi:DUF305 domain-containing protein [Actinokineospora sp.]|uniref:DUF305 domain-containing protein n=1 Tax=Actinokineospora sp. TaxID=1872133 RepID=UPI0040377DDC